MTDICIRKTRKIFQKDKAWSNKFGIEKYEKCVVCKGVTDIPISMPIDERKCYVPGGGQLCRKCCIELYGTDDLRSL